VDPRELTLRDGSRLLVRPIAPEDRGDLRVAFERLSQRSRYRRFFSPMDHLTESQLDYLTDIDHHDHEALVALDVTSGSGIVGVARFVRSNGVEAEPAIVVADDWQGRGVGTALLASLAERSREEGVERYKALVLAENDDVVRLLGQVGEVRESRVGSELEVEVLLDVGRPAAPSLLTVLRAAAEGTLTPGRALLQRLIRGSREAAEEPPPLRNTIVVGTDGSSGRSVGRAAEVAAALGATVELVSAHRPLLDDVDEVDQALREVAGQLEEDGLQVEVHLRRGDPASSLVDVAVEERARLIVVGASSRPRAARLLPGAIAEAVTRDAPCDVLVVRAP
jgi:nucleotide-binding universal stress UspA family protein/GNAT superfamily N-acetyltransferase